MRPFIAARPQYYNKTTRIYVHFAYKEIVPRLVGSVNAPAGSLVK